MSSGGLLNGSKPHAVAVVVATALSWVASYVTTGRPAEQSSSAMEKKYDAALAAIKERLDADDAAETKYADAEVVDRNTQLSLNNASRITTIEAKLGTVEVQLAKLNSVYNLMVQDLYRWVVVIAKKTLDLDVPPPQYMPTVGSHE